MAGFGYTRIGLCRLTSLLIYSYILFGECVKGLRMIALREKDILLYLSGKVQICKKGSQKVIRRKICKYKILMINLYCTRSTSFAPYMICLS
jgi:hypothetical protein